jgi:hypothetical protein
MIQSQNISKIDVNQVASTFAFCKHDMELKSFKVLEQPGAEDNSSSTMVPSEPRKTKKPASTPVTYS